MVNVTRKEDCCGCAACAQVCPSNVSPAAFVKRSAPSRTRRRNRQGSRRPLPPTGQIRTGRRAPPAAFSPSWPGKPLPRAGWSLVLLWQRTARPLFTRQSTVKGICQGFRAANTCKAIWEIASGRRKRHWRPVGPCCSQVPPARLRDCCIFWAGIMKIS